MLEMPWRKFIPFDLLAGVIWGSYAALVGYFGGKAFEEEPWKGLVLALAIAFGIAGAVEAARWYRRRRQLAS
jgi:membrane protein DedA with SNARE-associated domain